MLTEPGSLHWIDLDHAREAEARVLTEAFRFHPLAVEDTRLPTSRFRPGTRNRKVNEGCQGRDPGAHGLTA